MPHDANYWSAWAAAASAFAACASLVANLFSYSLSKRSAFAAEDAVRLSIRPKVRIFVDYVRYSEPPRVIVTMANDGPGVCRNILCWEEEPFYFRAFRHQPKDLDKVHEGLEDIAAKESTDFELPAESARYVFQFDDAIGNTEQRMVSLVEMSSEDGSPKFVVSVRDEALRRRSSY